MTVVSAYCERVGKDVDVELVGDFQSATEGEGRFAVSNQVAEGSCRNYSACRVGIPAPDDTKTRKFSCCSGQGLTIERRRSGTGLITTITERPPQFWDGTNRKNWTKSDHRNPY
jgi:hypothetical protein